MGGPVVLLQRTPALPPSPTAHLPPPIGRRTPGEGQVCWCAGGVCGGGAARAPGPPPCRGGRARYIRDPPGTPSTVGAGRRCAPQHAGPTIPGYERVRAGHLLHHPSPSSPPWSPTPTPTLVTPWPCTSGTGCLSSGHGVSRANILVDRGHSPTRAPGIDGPVLPLSPTRSRRPWQTSRRRRLAKADVHWGQTSSPYHDNNGPRAR